MLVPQRFREDGENVKSMQYLEEYQTENIFVVFYGQ